MSYTTRFQGFRSMLFGSGRSKYLILKQDRDTYSDTDSTASTKSSSWLKQAFTLNVWSLITLLLITVIGVWPRLEGNCDNRSVLWDIPEQDLTESLWTFEKKRFTSAIRDDGHGNLYRSIDPDDVQYAGLPSPEIDRHWDNLISEASEVSRLQQDPNLPALTEMPGNSRVPETGFYGGPDMLHSLHCLNAIRKHLDPEYYATSMTLPPEYRRMHIDHCVDHLRQALLCHGDLTPVTMKPVVANSSSAYPVTFYLGQTEYEHTCRGNAIRQWVTARGKRTGRIKPED